MTSFLETGRQIARYLSVVVVICGALILVKMQVQAFRLDDQIERGAVHRTQEEDATFHREFWSNFEVGARVLVVGCLVLSLTLTSGRALKAGWWTLGTERNLALRFLGYGRATRWVFSSDCVYRSVNSVLRGWRPSYRRWAETWIHDTALIE